jgi:PAS domain-containing protein
MHNQAVRERFLHLQPRVMRGFYFGACRISVNACAQRLLRARWGLHRDRSRRRQTNGYVMHATPNGMLAVDMSGIIIAANEGTAQVCGYKDDELKGQHLNCLCDFEIVHKSGRLVPVEIGLEPFLFEERFSNISNSSDITKRRRAERYKGRFLRARGRLDEFESVGLAAAVLDSAGGFWRATATLSKRNT